MSATIRPMLPADLGAVLRIERESFPSPWTPTMFWEELARADTRLWLVADSAAGIVGFGGLMHTGDDGHVMNLAVRRDCRGRGIGEGLLTALCEGARERGVRRLMLEVRPSNREAISLYDRSGFANIGRRPSYYEDTGEDAVVMWTGDLDSPDWDERLREAAVRRERALAGFTCERDPGPQDAEDGRDDIILAIETSCDETAAAVVRRGREVLSSVVASQVVFHRRFGGVVPEIASRKHTEAVVTVVEQAMEEAGIGFSALDAVAVTHGPGLVGALAVGLAYAKGLAMATGVPLVGVNHLEGHIFASVLADPDVRAPLVALVVSGGHTSLVHMPDWGEYRTLGSTLDDAAGEAFDKVAKSLGLGYPGGPVLSRLAEEGDPAAIPFPRAMIDTPDYDFSLSGLKTAVITHIRREREAGRKIDERDLAASFQQAVVDVQITKSVRAAKECGVATLCLAGGVAANPCLREQLREALAAEGVRMSVPPFALCTDNAVMIGAAAHYRLWRGERLGLDAEAVPNLALG